MRSIQRIASTDAKGSRTCVAGRQRGEFRSTFKEFPPRQRAASFTIDQGLEKMAEPMRKAA